jgi:polar amino acid transport system substrate-binding protein
MKIFLHWLQKIRISAHLIKNLSKPIFRKFYFSFEHKNIFAKFPAHKQVRSFYKKDLLNFVSYCGYKLFVYSRNDHFEFNRTSWGGKMKKIRISGITLILLVIFQSWVWADTITVACSPWKPHYHKENGVIKGTAYEIAKAVTERAGVKADFTVQPWKRVYKSGLEKPDYMISCISRIPEREELFHWIGPVNKGTFYNFYKLKKSNISLNTHKDTLKFSVGVLRGSVTQTFVEKNLGHKKVITVSRASQLISMLKIGRVDLILEATNVIPNESKLLEINPDIFELALIGYKVTTNLSLGKKAPLSLVNKLQTAYKSLEAEGKIILP